MTNFTPPPPIEVKSSTVITNPVWAATAVLLGFAGGYLVHAGLLTRDQLSALVPAVMTVGLAVWRWCVAQRRARTTVTLANAAPNSVATVTGALAKP